MRIAVLIILGFLFWQEALSQNYKLKISGDLSKKKTCQLIVLDSTGRKSKEYRVHGFILIIRDFNNQIALDTSNKRINGLMNEGSVVDIESFSLMWNRLKPGKYYVVFESIICVPINQGKKYNPDLENFRLPDKKMIIIKS